MLGQTLNCFLAAKAAKKKKKKGAYARKCLGCRGNKQQKPNYSHHMMEVILHRLLPLQNSQAMVFSFCHSNSKKVGRVCLRQKQPLAEALRSNFSMSYLNSRATGSKWKASAACQGLQTKQQPEEALASSKVNRRKRILSTTISHPRFSSLSLSLLVKTTVPMLNTT